MEKSVLEMIGGEKHINPHYDIKAESSSCYHSSEGFTGIEINGVRFSNIREMLIYMNKQRDRIVELEQQIEKMKCDVLSIIKDRMNDDIDQNIIERLADKWEIEKK